MRDALMVLMALVAALTLALLYLVVRQQGRMMLRIDDLEHRVSRLPVAVANGSNGIPVAAAAVARLGPQVGSSLEPFSLPGLDGREVSVADLEREHVLLVHWSPTCGYCDLIGPDLVELVPQLRGRGIDTVLLARGDADTNRALASKHGLGDVPILLLGDRPAAPGFDGIGTPAALLVERNGKIVRPLAVGAQQVPELGRDLVSSGKNKALRGLRPLSESTLVRDGLKPGTPAPRFELPDVFGQPFSLEALRGRRVLLAFSDPDCGPCQQLTPELSRLHVEHEENNLAVVMVSRGDRAVNRHKVESEGVAFPVVVQDGWKLSKEYGIFATPVGFLINEDGVIAADVATGVDGIIALAGKGE